VLSRLSLFFPAIHSTSSLASTSPLNKKFTAIEKKIMIIAAKKFSEIFVPLPRHLRTIIVTYLLDEKLDPWCILIKGGFHFSYIPKKTISAFSKPIFILNERRIKNQPGIRENRILEGEANILSRIVREFEYAQKAMHDEKDKEFLYTHPESFSKSDESAVFFERSSKSEELTVGKYRVGAFSFIGGRKTLETRSIATEFSLLIKKTNYKGVLFGIFDGHRGDGAAEYVRTHLVIVLIEMLIKYNPDGLHVTGIWNALKLTSVTLSHNYCKFSKKDGTTVLFYMELNGQKWFVNVGLSRALLNNDGVFTKLSVEAVPTDPRFAHSAKKRGGMIVNDKVFDMPVARSVGDKDYMPFLSARPKIIMLPSSYFLSGSRIILGCKGVFEVASSQQILKADQEHRDLSLSQFVKNIGWSIYQSGSLSNITFLQIRCP